MNAAAKPAGPHRCRCGEADPARFSRDSRVRGGGLNSRCKACDSRYYYEVRKPKMILGLRLRPFLGRSPKALRVHLFCACCGKAFDLVKSMYLVRMRQKRDHGRADENLYCGRACSAAHVGRVPTTARMKQGSRSDEQFLWEKKLTMLGLGMGAGTRSWLVYGQVDQDEMGRDRGNYGRR